MHISLSAIKILLEGAGEIAQRLRALAALPDVLIQFPATTWWLTTICNEIWCPLLASKHTDRQHCIHNK
ncbi:hypothetical protein LEMLEM_LOCUS13659 [Lemmus lemmus]